MKFKFGSQWLEDPTQITKLIKRVIDDSGESDRFLQKLDKDVVLFNEGDELDSIYILLEGVVDLYKKKPHADADLPVLRLQSGSLIGIISYTTGKPSLTTAITAEPCTVLKIPELEVRNLLSGQNRMQEYLDELILANLLERFRSTIILQMKLDSVNQKLQSERNELRIAYQELKKAQDQLIYQEKMATLGQLVAGFAHEVNNPAASLLRSTETLEQRISDLLNRPGDEESDIVRRFYEAGKKTGYPDTKTIREKSKKLEKVFEDVSSSLLRILAQVPEELIEELQKRKIRKEEDLESYLHYFEMGKMFQNIQSAGNRISGMVRSLKSYSRSDSDQKWEEVDIREGIHDTLQLTSNRIKYYDIDIDLEQIPKIRANPAALNQVWTNIILNASDAMGKNGSLTIRCNNDANNIWVTFQDSGPGIKEEIIDKIFDSKFTTKKSDAKFGLGLGLSISREIVHQHNGSITAKNSQKGGAIFTVTLPIKNK